MEIFTKKTLLSPYPAECGGSYPLKPPPYIITLFSYGTTLRYSILGDRSQLAFSLYLWVSRFLYPCSLSFNSTKFSHYVGRGYTHRHPFFFRLQHEADYVVPTLAFSQSPLNPCVCVCADDLPRSPPSLINLFVFFVKIK